MDCTTSVLQYCCKAHANKLNFIKIKPSNNYFHLASYVVAVYILAVCNAMDMNLS